MFPTIQILGRTVGVYALMAIAGAAAVVIFFVLNRKKTRFEVFDLTIFLLAIVTGLLIGGHLLYGITQYELIGKAFGKIGQISFLDFIKILGVAFGGNVFYGGLIGSYIALAIYLKARKIDLDNKRNIADVYSCSVPLFHAFGRVGCFFGGCCFGIESSFGFTAHGNIYSPDVNDVNRFPVQLLESSLNILLFIALVIVFKKGLLHGGIVWLYGTIYPVIRFCDEFLRGDVIRGFVLGLSTSQWISIFIFLLSVFMLVKRGTEKHREKHLQASAEAVKTAVSEEDTEVIEESASTVEE